MAFIEQITINNLVFLYFTIAYYLLVDILKIIKQEGILRLYRAIIILIRWVADEELIIIFI